MKMGKIVKELARVVTWSIEVTIVNGIGAKLSAINHNFWATFCQSNLLCLQIHHHTLRYNPNRIAPNPTDHQDTDIIHHIHDARFNAAQLASRSSSYIRHICCLHGSKLVVRCGGPLSSEMYEWKDAMASTISLARYLAVSSGSSMAQSSAVALSHSGGRQRCFFFQNSTC